MQNFWKAMWSMMASFLGVQSEKQRKWDSENGKPVHFIVSGVLLAALFVAIVAVITILVISTAT